MKLFSPQEPSLLKSLLCLPIPILDTGSNGFLHGLFLTQINTRVIPQESWEGDGILWIILSFHGGMLSFTPRAVGLYCDLDFSKGHIVLRMCLPGYLQIERSQILNLKKNDNDNIRGEASQIPARYSLEGRVGYTARYLFFFCNVSASLTI